jgi:hypothetical protein
MSSLGFTCCSECGQKLHASFFCHECGQACCSLDCYCHHVARHATPAQPKHVHYIKAAAPPARMQPSPWRTTFTQAQAGT